MELLHAKISDQILKAFYGFKNKLPIELDLTFFINAFEIELLELGLEVEKDKQIEIFYNHKAIGFLKTDLIVNNLVALKVVSIKNEISEKEINDIKTFLKMTKFELALILNFGPDGEHKRVILTNEFKPKKHNT